MGSSPRAWIASSGSHGPAPAPRVQHVGDAKGVTEQMEYKLIADSGTQNKTSDKKVL